MRILTLSLLLAAPVALAAQAVPEWAAPAAPPPPIETSNVLPPSPPTAPPAVPLDGGLTLLALAGAGYAAKRLKQR